MRDRHRVAEAAAAAGGYTVGVLVQANHGLRSQLRIAGVPVGAAIPVAAPARRRTAGGDWARSSSSWRPTRRCCRTSSKRIARRASLGLARTGATSGNGSGDIFIAFSTANPGAASANVAQVQMLSNDRMSALFYATVQATEEAIVNALVAAETMRGRERTDDRSAAS